MEDSFGFADAFGPARIVHIHRPSVNLKAIVVIDNTACGIAIGGCAWRPTYRPRNAFVSRVP